MIQSAVAAEYGSEDRELTDVQPDGFPETQEPVADKVGISQHRVSRKLQ